VLLLDYVATLLRMRQGKPVRGSEPLQHVLQLLAACKDRAAMTALNDKYFATTPVELITLRTNKPTLAEGTSVG
jgi:hypothetical protein